MTAEIFHKIEMAWELYNENEITYSDYEKIKRELLKLNEEDKVSESDRNEEGLLMKNLKDKIEILEFKEQNRVKSEKLRNAGVRVAAFNIWAIYKCIICQIVTGVILSLLYSNPNWISRFYTGSNNIILDKIAAFYDFVNIVAGIIGLITFIIILVNLKGLYNNLLVTHPNNR